MRVFSFAGCAVVAMALGACGAAGAADESIESRATTPMSRDVTLSGVAATRRPMTDAVTHALAKVLADAESQDTEIVGGSYEMPAAKLADFKLPIDNDPVSTPPVVASDLFSANLAFDAMFRVVDSVFSEEGTQRLDLESHDLECKAVPRSTGLRILRNSAEIQNVRKGLTQADKKQTFDANYQTVISALIPDSASAEVAHCHWTNTDDEDANALLSVDRTAGIVSVLVGFSPP
jgi:hypothetical protein